MSRYNVLDLNSFKRHRVRVPRQTASERAREALARTDNFSRSKRWEIHRDQWRARHAFHGRPEEEAARRTTQRSGAAFDRRYRVPVLEEPGRERFVDRAGQRRPRMPADGIGITSSGSRDYRQRTPEAFAAQRGLAFVRHNHITTNFDFAHRYARENSLSGIHKLAILLQTAANDQATGNPAFQLGSDNAAALRNIRRKAVFDLAAGFSRQGAFGMNSFDRLLSYEQELQARGAAGALTVQELADLKQRRPQAAAREPAAIASAGPLKRYTAAEIAQETPGPHAKATIGAQQHTRDTLQLQFYKLVGTVGRNNPTWDDYRNAAKLHPQTTAEELLSIAALVDRGELKLFTGLPFTAAQYSRFLRELAKKSTPSKPAVL